MADIALHHVSVLTTDVERSVEFYGGVLGLKRLPRPNFSTAGAWLGIGDRQIHLIVHPDGTRRTHGVDTDDIHFALRTGDFEGVLGRLQERGYHEGGNADDPRRMIVKRGGAAGFAQVFFMDPDRNIIEVNDAPL